MYFIHERMFVIVISYFGQILISKCEPIDHLALLALNSKIDLEDNNNLKGQKNKYINIFISIVLNYTLLWFEILPCDIQV